MRDRYVQREEEISIVGKEYRYIYRQKYKPTGLNNCHFTDGEFNHYLACSAPSKFSRVSFEAVSLVTVKAVGELLEIIRGYQQ